MANRLQHVRIFLLLGIIFTIQTSAVPLSQNELQELANSLDIRVKVVDNLRHEAKDHIVQTFIKNSGHSPIPDSGWTLYFHSMLPAFPDILLQEGNKSVDLHVEKVRIGLVQGDLFYMKPIGGFVPIKPGEERKYNVIVNLWAVSRTDFMPLWYVVSEDESVDPCIVHSTSSFDLDYVEPFEDVRQWKRWRADRYNPYTPEDRLARLKFTDTGKKKLIIPTPRNTRIDETVKLSSVDKSWGLLVDEIHFNETALFLKDLYDFKFISTETSNSIVLSRKNTFSKHGYSVNVSPELNRIFLQSNTTQGMFYAIQSLRAILEEYNSTNIPSIVIEDEPRFEWRGMHLDVARNFHSVGDVKRLIQAMSMYKMNALHLHLTDDEGWRLEIDGLPELTDVGGRRCHDLNETRCVIPQFGSGPFANTSGSGYYTKNDYRDILRFANIHFVTVIPEIDMPGHSHAAVVSMEQRYRKYIEAGNQTAAEEFRIIDPDDTTFYTSVQNWRDDVMNPCMNSTYALIGKVMDRVKALHEDVQPLLFYHFGGDEVPNGVWSKSPKCEELLQESLALNVTHGLKNYFAKRMAALAAVKNISLGGWEDGFIDGQKSPAPIPTDQMSGVELYVNPWNNIWEWGGGSNAYKYANAGYKVILTPGTNLYFDHPQEPGPEERGLYWATRFTDTKKVLKFMPDAFYDNIFEDRSGNPLSKEDICGEDLSKCTQLETPENIIGIQGALWSETVRTSENMDFMIFPRLLALAERSWYKAGFESTPKNKEAFEDEWSAFAKAVGSREFRRLNEMDIAFRIPPPGGRVQQDGNVQVTTTYPGLGVEISKDDGHSWQMVQQDIINNDERSVSNFLTGSEWDSVLLRSTFRNRDDVRYSRAVELKREVARPVVEQYMLNYIAENLLVHVEVVDNLNKDEEKYMTIKLELTNNGSMNIPSGAWRIYFYSLYGAKAEELSCGLTIEHVNGGLYYIEPTSDNFPGIPAGHSLDPCIIKNRLWMVSRTDNLPNWFVTSPGMTAMKLKATESETLNYVGKFDTAGKWKRERDDRFDPYTAPERYDILHRDSSTKPMYRVVPTPKAASISQHETAQIDDSFVVLESQEFRIESQFLAEMLKVNITNTSDSSKQIKFEVRENKGVREAYEINISPETNTVVIHAQDASGAFYGAQTLISLVEDNDGRIPKATISDEPRFGYRGVMLDVARNFKPKNWTLKFIDAMAMYKLNKLHLHLSDDEGWRIEIPSIPGLTEIGRKRCHSEYDDDCVMPQLGSGPDSDTQGTGFYTVDDYREILEYANVRHIEIIPEIDMPGHSAAAISVMEKREDDIDFMKSHANWPLPESWLLYDHKFTPSVNSGLKWSKSAMNPCMNSTYRFVELVVDGLIELHRPVQPLRIFHMGGDEVAHGAWDESKECFDNTDFRGFDTAASQRVFMKRVAKVVSDKGLSLGVWEDGVYADDKPNPITDFTSEVFVYPWNNRWGTNKAKRSSEFADAGYKVILPLATHLYFDMSQEPDPESQGLYWATRFIDARKVFGLMPDNIFANADVDRMGNPVSLDDLCGKAACPQPKKTENIMGLQACMWAEVMRTEEHFHNMAFPRLLALAERSWHRAAWEGLNDRNARNDYRKSDWEEFVDVLGYKELPRLEKKQVYYFVEPPGARVDGNVLKANTRYPNHLVEISTDGGDTWNEFQQQTLDNGRHTLHFRTKSPVLGRVSRPVELTAVVGRDGSVGSAKAFIPTYLIIVLNISLLLVLGRVV